MKNNRYRHTVQILFFVFIGLFALNHTLSPKGEGTLLPFLPNISLHAACPFGGVESVISLVMQGTLVRKLSDITLIISGTVLLLTVILGPVFCSYVCPLGTLQEGIGKLGRKLFKKRYNTFIPKKAHNVLKNLRYVTLGLVVVFTYNAMSLVFTEVDPYYAMYHFFTGKAAIGGIIVLCLTLVASLFVERPWCKYLCPYGAFLGLIGKLSPFKIRNKQAACIGCAKCSRVCPMNINIEKTKAVSDAQCIRCLNCVTDESLCGKSALTYGTAGTSSDTKKRIEQSPAK